jgi:hypothetical protein
VIDEPTEISVSTEWNMVNFKSSASLCAPYAKFRGGIEIPADSPGWRIDQIEQGQPMWVFTGTEIVFTLSILDDFYYNYFVSNATKISDTKFTATVTGDMEFLVYSEPKQQFKVSISADEYTLFYPLHTYAFNVSSVNSPCEKTFTVGEEILFRTYPLTEFYIYTVTVNGVELAELNLDNEEYGREYIEGIIGAELNPDIEYYKYYRVVVDDNLEIIIKLIDNE